MTAAGLQEATIAPMDRVYCNGEFHLGAWTFKDWKEGGHGSVDLQKALAQSCNIFYYQAGLKIGGAAITKYARAFGFGTATGVELGGEKLGLIPQPKGRRKSWQGGDIVNMSIEGYLDPSHPESAQVYLLFHDAVSYCRDHSVAVFAAAGNEHVRVDRVDLNVGGRELSGVGQVTDGSQGFASVTPGSPSLSDYDLRGLLEVPAGLPGVTMVSATANAIGAAPANVPLRWRAHVGARDQLAYYSNYGSRIDLAAPGGARRYEVPFWDGGAGDVTYGGWGSLGALAPQGLICTDPVTSALFNAACFKLGGQSFGWLQGTSMATPNAAGVAALVLSAHRDLRGHPDALVARLQGTANQSVVNYMGPNDPSNFAPSVFGDACPTGYCHLDQSHPISFGDAYGAGLVDADAAVR